MAKHVLTQLTSHINEIEWVTQWPKNGGHHDLMIHTTHVYQLQRGRMQFLYFSLDVRC